MSASLVGSEMCIRDRPPPPLRIRSRSAGSTSGGRGGPSAALRRPSKWPASAAEPPAPFPWERRRRRGTAAQHRSLP
eukprot:6619308-Alexandrium_andersonii.AAC.1